MAPDTVKIYKDEPRAGTFLIAKGFERPHKAVTNLINKHKARFESLDNKSFSKGLIIRKVSVKKAGRPVEEYVLNEAQTLFLGTLFRNSEIVLDFKQKLVAEFIEMKETLRGLGKHKDLSEYIQTRKISISVRKETTKTIEYFIAYAEMQGSKNAHRYYGNFTKMANGLLFISEGKFKNFREVMTVRQLMVMSAAEGIIEKSILEEIAKGVFYKDIYQAVKKKVKIFADIHGQSEVMDKQLKLCE